MTTTLKDKNRLIVPPSIQRQAGFKIGDRLEFKVSEGIVSTLPKLPAKDDEYTQAERRGINARLAKSEADVKLGRLYGPFDSATEMGVSLAANITRIRAAKKRVPPAR